MKRVMKRALADRAKLDLPQNDNSGITGGAGSPAMSSGAQNNSESGANGRISYMSSPPEGQPPLKMQRIASGGLSSTTTTRENPPSVQAPPSIPPALPVIPKREESTASMSSAGAPPPLPSPRTALQRPENARSMSSSQVPPVPTSLKRPRREASSNLSQPQQQQQQSSLDQETDTSSAFYLQHQNRALAIELKSLQAQVRGLTEEREYRRKSCLQALQALHSLQATWTSLETALGQEPPPTPSNHIPASPDMPSSTAGDSDETAVEWTAALHAALQALGNQKRTAMAATSNGDHSLEDDENDGTASQREMMSLGEMAANVTGRANCLQEWLWKVLRSKNVQLPEAEEVPGQRSDRDEAQRLQAQVAELTQSRDDFSSKERRLRRNIYRLDVGMITEKQLIQSVVAGTDSIDDDPERMAVQKEAVLKGALGSGKSIEDDGATKSASDTVRDSVSAKVVTDLERQLEDAKQEVANRDKSIEEMNGRVRDLERRVNDLSVKQQSDGDKEKLESFETMEQKLGVAERDSKELEDRLEKTRGKWAQSAGNEKTLMKSLEELQDKHQKRWSELTATEESAQETGEVTPAEIQARRIAELEHKLSQAVENVRQAETARSNLRDALTLNETLQGTVSELKGKLAALQAEKTEKGERSSSRSGPSSGDQNHTTPAASSSKSESHSESKSHHHHREGGSERISAEKAEKLYRENKKMRKEIAAVIASKEGHKAKLERVEKERNSLVDVNARLLEQATEKDEMNAKSLSSILHLKSLTEQLTQERENLEQQVKSAEQLALAARLATNAKERLAEELVKEKTSIEEELKDLEQKHAETRKELSQKTTDCADASGKTTTLNAELSNALKRCDEFVTQAEEQRTEIRKLLDALEKAERQAKEAREKLSELAKNSSSNSGFTTDQLTTQVQVLKNRLACPVCHFRDKECIIMRCRHMHCKQCVEERLANRSRRCPTCNNPFGRTDVEDIFLG